MREIKQLREKNQLEMQKLREKSDSSSKDCADVDSDSPSANPMAQWMNL